MMTRIGITRQYRTMDPDAQAECGPWHSYDTAHVPHFREGLHIEFRDMPEPLEPGIYIRKRDRPDIGPVYLKFQHCDGQWSWRKLTDDSDVSDVGFNDDAARAGGYVKMVAAK